MYHHVNPFTYVTADLATANPNEFISVWEIPTMKMRIDIKGGSYSLLVKEGNAYRLPTGDERSEANARITIDAVDLGASEIRHLAGKPIWAMFAGDSAREVIALARGKALPVEVIDAIIAIAVEAANGDVNSETRAAYWAREAMVQRAFLGSLVHNVHAACIAASLDANGIAANPHRLPVIPAVHQRIVDILK